MQLEISLKSICKIIFFTPFQYISSTLSNLVHTGLHTQQSTFRSLAERLFSAATPRVILVATDVADVLDYLHNSSWPTVIHCDLKPSNVLLDDVMGAHLADFGLAKFLHSFSHSCHQSSTSLLGPRGSIGYIAPGENFWLKDYKFLIL